MPIKTEICPSLYQDSVVLMRIASEIRSRPGIHEAAAFMGTPSNHALLEEVGLGTEESLKAGPNDVILTVKSETEAAAEAALAAARASLSARRSTAAADSEVSPRTLDSALRAMPDTNLAAISVPGAYAKFEAMRALRRNLNVFLFSDNVSVEDEIELKQEALSRGLLCMGPDCGTAYLNGKGLGFFNVVPRGRVGCVAASGTGLQALASYVAALGEGISHGIGVGGRDLSAELGGAMTVFALEALAADPATEAVVLVSKPPHREVMARIEATLAKIGKPTVVCCLGAPANLGGHALWVRSLDQAAQAIVAFLRDRQWAPRTFSDPVAARARFNRMRQHGPETGPGILGLYTGGTLAHEARLLLEPLVGRVAFNGHRCEGKEPHRIIDLGDDAYTVGRPHPMIAPETRSEFIRDAGRSAEVGVLLLDLVLGRGAHRNPARPLADAVRDAGAAAESAGRRQIAIASVVGTATDPQGLDRQVAQLVDAGVLVFPSNAEAARFAAMVVNPELAKRLLEDDTR